MVFNKLKSWLLVVLFFSILLFLLFAGLYSSVSVINSPVDVRIYCAGDSLIHKITVFGTSPINTRLPIQYNPGLKSWHYNYFRPYKAIYIEGLQSTGMKFDSILLTVGDNKSVKINSILFSGSLQKSGKDVVDISTLNREKFLQKLLSLVYFKPFRILLYAMIFELILILSLVYKNRLKKLVNSLKIFFSRLIMKAILFLGKRGKMLKSHIAYYSSKMITKTGSAVRFLSWKLKTKTKQFLLKLKLLVLNVSHKIFSFIHNISVNILYMLSVWMRFFADSFYKNPVNLILVIFGVFFLAYFINVIILLFSYNLDLGNGMEYVFILYFKHLSETGSLYSNPASPPFLPNIFLPLYFYTVYFIQKLLPGGSFDNIHSIYITGRIISFLAFTGTLIIVFQILTKQLKASKKTGFISVMLILILSFSQSFIFRPDSLKTFFFVLSVYLFIYYKLHNKKYLIILFSATSILAFFTKQDGLLVAGIISILLFSKKNSYPFLLYVSASIIIALILLLLIYLFDHSIILFSQIDLIKLDGISFWYLYQWFLPYLLKILPVVLFIIYLSFKYFIKEKTNESVRKILLVTTLFTFSLPLVFSLKNGASIYYYTEFQIFAIIIITDYIEKRPPFINQYRKYILSIVLILYIAFLFNYKNIIKVSSGISVNYKMGWYDKGKEIKSKNNYFRSEAFYKKFRALYPLNESEYLICFDVPVTLFASTNFFNMEMGYYWTAMMAYITNDQLFYRKTLYPLDRYYKYFDDGRVKYIIVQNFKKGKSFIKEFFPNYCYFKDFGGFTIYRWTAYGKVKRIAV